MDPQVPVRTAHNCLRHDFLNFLRQYTDIDLVGTVVGKPIESKAVVEVTEKNNVVLERNVGPASTTAPAASASTSAASESGRSEAAAPASAHARTVRMSLGVAHRRVGSRLRPMACSFWPASVL